MSVSVHATAETPLLNAQDAQEQTNTAPELEEIGGSAAEQEKNTDNGCFVPAASEDFVDELRSQSHTRLCNTAGWLDGLFGDKYRFNGEDFRGKISLGFRQDEFDGFEPRLRVRIKTDLPNVSQRFSAFLGRVEEDSYISNTEVDKDRLNNVGLRSTNDDESEWLFGLGYRNPNKDSNGFDYSIGAKLSSGLSPYAKVAHRYLFKSGNKHYWRTTQTGFWRRQEGFGVSSRLDYTYILGDRDIMEWDTNVKYTREAKQWEWISSTVWHHEFTRTTGISSRMYVRGEEENPVSVPEYGITFTYVRPFLRDWMTIETGVNFRWEKEKEEDRYENAIRLGVQIEMQLGDYYQRGKR